MTNQTEFKVGDIVTDVIYQEVGEVYEIEEFPNYPVIVRFKSARFRSYTKEGRHYLDYKTPSLYHGTDVTIEIKQPVYEYQVICKRNDGSFFISEHYYKTTKEYEDFVGVTFEFIELYLPSKRVRKE